MTTQSEEKGLPVTKTKATKGKKKAAGAAGSASKAAAKPKGEPKPMAAKKAPKAAKTPPSAKIGKGDKIIELMQRKGGATLVEMQNASDWQAHSVRGFLSGIVRKKMGLTIVSVKPEGGERTYSMES